MSALSLSNNFIEKINQIASIDANTLNYSCSSTSGTTSSSSVSSLTPSNINNNNINNQTSTLKILQIFDENLNSSIKTTNTSKSSRSSSSTSSLNDLAELDNLLDELHDAKIKLNNIKNSTLNDDLNIMDLMINIRRSVNDTKNKDSVISTPSSSPISTSSFSTSSFTTNPSSTSSFSSPNQNVTLLPHKTLNFNFSNKNNYFNQNVKITDQIEVDRLPRSKERIRFSKKELTQKAEEELENLMASLSMYKVKLVHIKRK